MKKITILGSTGSIGTQALEVIEKLEGFEVIALSAGKNIELLKQQIKKFMPKIVCVQNEEDIPKIKQEFANTEVVFGESGLIELCSNKENDLILTATSGKIALRPTLTAIENGINIALANKETLVMAGDIVMKKAKEKNVKILPVDSEHSAIFQCTEDFSNIEKIIITASGGPFLHKTKEEMESSSLKEALEHPRWKMGKKITIDSATLMNKGLEVIEAHHLFNIDYEKIDIIIHPQSIIHSAVEFKDGSTLAQLGNPTMHIPIQYALTYPERKYGIESKSFNFLNHNLTFEKPDFEKFRCLKLALEAGKIGGSMPCVLSCANDIAVDKFLKNEISINKIPEIVEKAMEKHSLIKNPSIDDLFEIDKQLKKDII
ncbi:MAG: 1-deoxy-D-xylulose-5-phosphate reductoisomerase [Cyanobacteria bacterium SIG30]|nr:1-deoxy-D-xylulose-5-phosphate reductoisomerase [Cyanobacteria bacterium SIG30]